MRTFNKLFIFSAFALSFASCGEKTVQQKAVLDEVIKVTATTVKAEYVPQITVYPTTIEADIVNNIAPQSAGRIKNINVEVGDFVQAGQRLATMDAISLDKARLQMVNDSIEFGRIKNLYEIGAVSQSDYDAMSLKYDVTKKTYDNLLENTILTSPAKGIVTARNYDKGDMYTMALPLFVVQDITPIRMKINISEKHFSDVKKGMDVDFTVESYKNEVFKGKIDLIYPTVDSHSHTFQAEVICANSDLRLRPGMFARVSLNFGDQFHVVVPDRAVQRQIGAGDLYVYILKEDGTASYSLVEIGQHFGESYEIISGIDDGATVITSGQTKLRNGIKVEVVE